MHCLTVTHGMQEFTSPQSVDVSVKTLKEDSFSSSPLLFSLWPQPLPFFLSIQFNSILFVQHQNNSHLKVLAIPFFVFISPYLHQLSPHCGGKKTIITLKNFSISHVIQPSSKRAGTVYEIWIKAECNALHISWSISYSQTLKTYQMLKPIKWKI